MKAKPNPACELLSERILSKLTSPKTMNELMIEIPNQSRDHMRQQLSILRKNNFIVKVGDHFQYHPVYKRVNGL